MLRYIFLLFFFNFLLHANYSYYKIIIGSYSKVDNATAEIELYKKGLSKDEEYNALLDSKHFYYHIYHGKKYHTVSIRPFKNRKDAVEVLKIVHKISKSPYLGTFKTAKPIVFKNTDSTASSSSNSSSSQMMIIEKVKDDMLIVKESSREKKEPKKSVVTKEIKKPKVEKKVIEPKVSKVEVQKEVIAPPVIKKEEKKPKKVEPKKKIEEVKKTEPLIKKAPPKDPKPIESHQSSDLVSEMLGYFPYFIYITLLGLIFILIRQNRALKEENAELLDESIQNATLSKTKDDFLTKMSHEIRTPMNAIVGFSHILLETKLDTNQLGHLRNIQNAADLLLSVINDILNFSKIEHGDARMRKLQFNINDVLDDISKKMLPNSREKDLELVFEVANNVPSRIIGDEEKFHDVILNLISNAIKYTNSGEVILKLKRLDSEAELIVLECKISDTGIGIKKEALSKLFDSFEQVENTNIRQYDGMGLGLAIVKEYVHLMGGEIKVQSEFGKGSTFTFSVCFDSPAKIDPRNYRLPDKSIMYKKVLVVDDNTSAAGSLQRMIAYYHYHADIVNSEEEAILLLKNHEYDILCIDSKLLDESLDDTIQRYKEFSNAKIVILENDVVKKLGSSVKGIDAELKKPFSQQDIFNTIIELYSEVPPPIEHKKATKEGVAQFKGKTILLAEDNRINQSVIKSLLAGTGINLLIANNGQEAIDMLYEHKEVDMIFMDISMPVMNGYDAAINIRKDSTYADLPIVALTANILPSDIQKSIDSGMQEHIGKPFNVTAFYDAIIKYLSTTPIDEFNSSEPEVQKSVEVKESEAKSETVEKTIYKVESEDDTLDVDILDRERGLDLVGNDKELLQELLEEFILMYKDSVSKLDALIESRDYSSGQKLSHDIKGVSANLGLMQVHERVKALEMTFKAEDSEDGKRELEKYAQALKMAIQEIQS